MSLYVVGAGCSRGCPPEELLDLIEGVLKQGGIDRGDVSALATIATRVDEPAIVEVARCTGWPLRAHPAAALAAVQVPNPSAVVASHVGTPSVAEAAALLSVPGGRVLVSKQRSRHATCAVAEAAR